MSVTNSTDLVVDIYFQHTNTNCIDMYITDVKTKEMLFISIKHSPTTNLYYSTDSITSHNLEEVIKRTVEYISNRLIQTTAIKIKNELVRQLNVHPNLSISELNIHGPLTY